MILMGVMGYRRRVGFLAGLTVAQISEFSLILAALGLTLGHIDSQTVSLITVVGLITIGLSTYLILYSYPLYDRLAPHLGLFERRSLRTERIEVPPEVNVVIFGAGRYGSRLTTELAAAGLRVLVVDHDPQALARLPHTHVETLYGDAEEPELALALPMTSAGCVVSTIPNRDVSLSLLHGIRAAGFTGPFLATAHNPLDTRLLLGSRRRRRPRPLRGRRRAQHRPDPHPRHGHRLKARHDTSAAPTVVHLGRHPGNAARSPPARRDGTGTESGRFGDGPPPTGPARWR